MNNIRPAIIAICGAAASGKDTLLYHLAPALGATKIVSDTTRPKRPGEYEGVDYHYISVTQFAKNIEDDKYLEYTVFRHWFYGTPKDAICGKVNIGVFNINGILSLLEYQDNYNIYPILLKTNPIVRLKRYIHRDGKFRLECLRRLWVDFEQFADAENLLEYKVPQHLVLKNFDVKQNLDDLTQYLVSEPLSAYYQ